MLNLAVKVGAFNVGREFIRAAKEGRPVSLAIIDEITRVMERRFQKAVAGMTRDSFLKQTDMRALVKKTPDLAALRQLLLERAKGAQNAMRGYRFLIQDSAVKSGQLTLAIGRRGQDILRETTLKTLERGFLKGNARELLSDTLV